VTSRLVEERQGNQKSKGQHRWKTKMGHHVFLAGESRNGGPGTMASIGDDHHFRKVHAGRLWYSEYCWDEILTEEFVAERFCEAPFQRKLFIGGIFSYCA